ncbi:MAG TPA: sigma-70 family RNA polymerase sigma factor [Verrucomicrobiae bacterium]|nr:sigma-70 family RNA polymerase sigma factor [Verrucomicrobiae bacterium]
MEDAPERRRILTAAYSSEAAAIYHYVVRRVGSPADAEDCTAETFLRALRGHQALDPARVRGLLFTIARAVVAEHWARLYSEAPSPVEGLDAGIRDPTAPAGPDAGERRVELAEQALDRRVAALLSALPDNYRRVLELRFLEGCSVRETALRMEVRPGNVRVLQLRALRRAAGLGSLLP